MSSTGKAAKIKRDELGELARQGRLRKQPHIEEKYKVILSS